MSKDVVSKNSTSDGEQAGQAETTDDLELTDDELQQLELELKKLKTRAEINKLKQVAPKDKTVALDEIFPEHQSKPLEGKVELGENAGYFAELLAFDSIGEAARTIANEVRTTLNVGTSAKLREFVVLVVEDRSLSTADWVHEHVTRLLAIHLSTLRGVLTELDTAEALTPHVDVGDHVTRLRWGTGQTFMLRGPFPGEILGQLPKAGAAGVGALADLIGMFRADYKLVSRTVPATGPTLAVASAAALAKQEVRVVLDGFALLEGSRTYQELTTAVEARDKLAAKQVSVEATTTAIEHELASLQSTLTNMVAELLKQLTVGKPDKTAVERLRQEIKDTRQKVADAEARATPGRALVDRSKACIAAFDEMVKALLTTPAAGLPPIVAAALRERLHADTKQPGSKITHVLFVGTDSAGGDVVTERKLFGRSGMVTYLAGSHVSWLLMKTDKGEVVGGATQPTYRRVRYDLATGNCERADSLPVQPIPPRGPWQFPHLKEVVRIALAFAVALGVTSTTVLIALIYAFTR